MSVTFNSEKLSTVRRRFYVAIAAGLAVAGSTMSATAQTTYNWVGNAVSTPSWGTLTNWSPNLIAATNINTTNNFVYPTSSGVLASSFLGNPRTIRSLTFGDGLAGGFATDLSVTFRVGAGGLSHNLTMAANGSGVNPTLNILSDVSGVVTLGAASAESTTVGNLVLSNNLTINHNGTNDFVINRNITTTAGATIRKTGTGRWVQATNGTGTPGTNFDLGSIAALELDGGALEMRVPTVSPFNKSLSLPITVSSASTLSYNNLDSSVQTPPTPNTSDRTFSVNTGLLTLNAGLTVENISPTNGTNLNRVEITRDMTGAGNLTVSTITPLSSIADNFSPRRVQISGNNSTWGGSLVVARGSAQISGGANSISTGNAIAIGTTDSADGAGLAINRSVDIALGNITVRSGTGLRALKNVGSGAIDITIASVSLEGGNTLVLDHSLDTGKSVTVSGNVTGLGGGLTIARVGGDAGSFVRLSGANNTYTGATTVNPGAALIVDGSLTSNITVNNGRFGGTGSTTGSLTMSTGSTLVFDPLNPTFDVTGTVSLPTTFGVASLVNIDGSAINWSSINPGVYTLIGTTPTVFSAATISNFGLGNAVEVVPNLKMAYFANGSLDLVVAAIPEPLAITSLLAISGTLLLRRQVR
jgi:fibronectin-binding autotransporter adhesin